MNRTSDFVDYIIRYNRLYETGQVFDEYTFKSSDGRIVPILFAECTPKVSSTFDYSKPLGHAVLEERDDGLVAKCNFRDDPHGSFLKRCLRRGDFYTLTFQTTPYLSLDKTVEHGIITAVLIIPKWAVYQLDEREVNNEANEPNKSI